MWFDQFIEIGLVLLRSCRIIWAIQAFEQISILTKNFIKRWSIFLPAFILRLRSQRRWLWQNILTISIIIMRILLLHAPVSALVQVANRQITQDIRIFSLLIKYLVSVDLFIFHRPQHTKLIYLFLICFIILNILSLVLLPHSEHVFFNAFTGNWLVFLVNIIVPACRHFYFIVWLTLSCCALFFLLLFKLVHDCKYSSLNLVT